MWCEGLLSLNPPATRCLHPALSQPLSDCVCPGQIYTEHAQSLLYERRCLLVGQLSFSVCWLTCVELYITVAKILAVILCGVKHFVLNQYRYTLYVATFSTITDTPCTLQRSQPLQIHLVRCNVHDLSAHLVVISNYFQAFILRVHSHTLSYSLTHIFARLTIRGSAK